MVTKNKVSNKTVKTCTPRCGNKELGIQGGKQLKPPKLAHLNCGNKEATM